jgi:alpha-L-rhamnosidase
MKTSWCIAVAITFATVAEAYLAPVAILKTSGGVSNAEALVAGGPAACTLDYPVNGTAPSVALDFGSGGVGGYAVFRVTAVRGTPVVRLAYACHPDGLSPTGDFLRERRAMYMGPAVELPVLPANLDRYELYTIRRTGTFIAPLVQGLARYVLVRVDTPGTSVSMDSVAMANSEVFDDARPEGSFRCSDERLNRVWDASVRTLQIASFPNADAWKSVDGWLLPRKLEKAGEIGLSRETVSPADETVETRFELRTNPHFPATAGLVCRAKDNGNALIIALSQPALLGVYYRANGRDNLIHTREFGPELVDGKPFDLSVSFKGSRVTVKLDGKTIDDVAVPPAAGGRVGFLTPKEAWPLFDFIRVRDAQGKVVFEDGFDGKLDRWEFARTLPFVADGAKRDRLIWSGDLWWAERNRFYAFANDRFMRGSIQMLAFNQTPEGYVEACPYAENSVPPVSGDFGPFQSDEFAAWLIPVAADYLLYTGDTRTLEGLWPSVERLLGYLDRSCGKDGLFNQRYETSKFAYSPDLGLGVTESRAYMDILLWLCWKDAADIADSLGKADIAGQYRAKAAQLKGGIDSALWDDAAGCYREAVGNNTFGEEGNALALATRFATPERARRISARFRKVASHGKFQALLCRGKFEYGLTADALDAINDFPNWFKLTAPEWKGLALTSECLGLVRSGWGDEAHPDTAIAGILSSYVLGVVPSQPGFKRFVFRPQPFEGRLTSAEGRVPTPHGTIEASWRLDNGTLKCRLVVPQGTLADVEVSPQERKTLSPGANEWTEVISGLRNN